MDELAIRLGIKLLVFCTLFVGFSLGVKALRGRPVPKVDRGPPPGWYDLPKPDPDPTPPSDTVGPVVVSEAELDRLCQERAQRMEARNETLATSAFDRHWAKKEQKSLEAEIKPLATRVSGARHR